jgi:hypothetical protein
MRGVNTVPVFRHSLRVTTIGSQAPKQARQNILAIQDIGEIEASAIDVPDFKLDSMGAWHR